MAPKQCANIVILIYLIFPLRFSLSACMSWVGVFFIALPQQSSWANVVMIVKSKVKKKPANSATTGKESKQIKPCVICTYIYMCEYKYYVCELFKFMVAFDMIAFDFSGCFCAVRSHPIHFAYRLFAMPAPTSQWPSFHVPFH